MSEKLELRLVYLVLGIMFAMFLVLSQSTHWADSEMWSISVARDFGLNTWDYASHYKILFSLLLHQLYAFDLDDVSTLNGARVLFSLVGGLILIFTYLNAYYLSRSRRIAGWSVLMLATSSFFLSQGFRVRSDILACACQLIGLWCYLKLTESEGRKSWGWAAGLVFFNLLMLLSTPKSIYHLIVSLVLIVNDLRLQRPLHRFKRTLWVCTAAGAIAFLSVIAFNWPQFKSAVDYYMASFGARLGRPGYISLGAFAYYQRFVAENIPLVVAFILALALLPTQWRKLSPRARATLVAAACALFFLLIHNDRLPFFLVSLLPLPCIAVFQVIESWLGVTDGHWRQLARGVLLTALLANGCFYVLRFVDENNNSLQRMAMDKIKEYVATVPGANYFDGTGALPRTSRYVMNIEPGSPMAVQHILDLLKDQKPEVVFFANRYFFYMGEILSFLSLNDYIHSGGGAYVKANVRHLKKHEGVNTDKLCAPYPKDQRFVYVGDDFIQMKLESNPKPLRKKTTGKVIACSQFGPLSFPMRMTFAEIFDFDRQY